ncbi:hypothetical protein [Glycomyces amatae]|nr:hypothetical protein [Glycomyces amatae]
MSELAGLLETYAHAYPQLEALHKRLTEPLTAQTDSPVKGSR